MILFDYEITFFENPEIESSVCGQSGFELSIGLTQLLDTPDEIDCFTRFVRLPIAAYIAQKVSEFLSTAVVLESVTAAGDQPTFKFIKGIPQKFEIEAEIESQIQQSIGLYQEVKHSLYSDLRD